MWMSKGSDLAIFCPLREKVIFTALYTYMKLWFFFGKIVGYWPSLFYRPSFLSLWASHSLFGPG